MEKQLGSEYHPSERIKFLKDNCDAVEDVSYMKQFTHEEIAAMKENLAESSIKLNDLKHLKAETVKTFGEKIKPVEREIKGVLTHLKQKAINVDEECFKFVDHTEENVGYYNALGDLVLSRPIMPQERQKTIFNFSKSGTND